MDKADYISLSTMAWEKQMELEKASRYLVDKKAHLLMAFKKAVDEINAHNPDVKLDVKVDEGGTAVPETYLLTVSRGEDVLSKGSVTFKGKALEDLKLHFFVGSKCGGTASEGKTDEFDISPEETDWAGTLKTKISESIEAHSKKEIEKGAVLDVKRAGQILGV